MNKKILGQIDMYLGGLLARLNDNESSSEFLHINIQFKSGTKTYPAMVKRENEFFKWEYNGRTDSIGLEEISKVVLSACEKYDSVSLDFVERAKTITISADEKRVRMLSETAKTQIETMKRSAENSHIGNREYLIKAGEADSLLKAIGIMAPNGKIKNDMIRKYNQIDHFVELMNANLKELCSKTGQITVLDCACGKSYLSFVLNYYIVNVLRRKCRFIGVDYSETVIEASKKMAELGYTNMTFVKADLKEFTPDTGIDLCISLHACDTATDMALACAMRNGAGMIVAVPCCHKELLSQYNIHGLEPLLRYGILKARISDALTDSLRANYLEAMGYEVSVVEYISPLETPKNLMIRALRKGKLDYDKLTAYWDLCSKLGVSPSLPEMYIP